MAVQNGLFYNAVSRFSPKTMLIVSIGSVVLIEIIYIPLASYVSFFPLSKIINQSLWIPGIVFAIQFFLFGLILNKWQVTKSARIFLLIVIILSFPLGLAYLFLYYVSNKLMELDPAVALAVIDDISIYNCPLLKVLMGGSFAILICSCFAFILTIGNGWGNWLREKPWKQKQNEDNQESLELQQD
ncbi:MAG: hypothetical protein JXA52_00695 [Planctomycetes bacterium]|nr:hypothetical protein [Planctomycetota bacterium]